MIRSIVVLLSTSVLLSSAGGQSLPEKIDEDSLGYPSPRPLLQQQRQLRSKMSPNGPVQILSPYAGIVDREGRMLVQNAPAREKVTASELSSKTQNGTTFKLPKSANNRDPEKVDRPSLYDNCEILVSRGTHTVVPEGAILKIPTHLQERVAENPDGRFLIWPDFLRQNRSWITCREVTYDIATGNKALPDSQKIAISNSNRLVVAVLRRGPISVRQSVEDEDQLNEN